MVPAKRVWSRTGRFLQTTTLFLQLERAENVDEAWLAQAESVAREVVKLRTAIEVVAVGSLPNDGSVIEDSRDY
ncbi:hypothetical protein OURE66S_02760 [Oligella ureolytica]